MFKRILTDAIEEELVNIDCDCIHILSYLKEKCKLSPTETIDLCEEDGTMMATRLKTQMRGLNVLTNDFYVVVKRNDTSNNEWVPINKEYLNNMEFMETLKTSSNGNPPHNKSSKRFKNDQYLKSSDIDSFTHHQEYQYNKHRKFGVAVNEHSLAKTSRNHLSLDRVPSPRITRSRNNTIKT